MICLFFLFFLFFFVCMMMFTVMMMVVMMMVMMVVFFLTFLFILFKRFFQEMKDSFEHILGFLIKNRNTAQIELMEPFFPTFFFGFGFSAFNFNLIIFTLPCKTTTGVDKRFKPEKYKNER